MIKIVMTNVYSKLEFSDLDTEAEQYKYAVKTIYDKLKVFDKNAPFSEKFNIFKSDGSRIWDGYVRFFNINNYSFLTGHVPYVTNILDGIKAKYILVDKCASPTISEIQPAFKFNGIELRPYQKEGLLIAIKKAHRGVYYQAVNSGKTILAIGITESIPVKTLFLVDRVELLNQAYKMFKKYSSREIGIISASEFEPREITIGMQKTIWSKLKNKYTKQEVFEYLNSISMVFGDEAHKSTSQTWKDVLKVMHNAYYRYGLSGTALLTDPIRNMYLVGLIGPVIQKISNKYLIEHGYSAKPNITIISHNSPKISAHLEYLDLYKEGIVQNDIRNNIIANIIKEHQGKSILVIVRHIEHGEIIKGLLEKSGYFVSGQDSKTERMFIYNNFSNKNIPIVIASMIYKEGIDISAIDVLIYAAGEKSPVTILQVMGRGLRTRPDKKVLKYYDFYDINNKHLKKHTEQRIKIYQKEEFELELINS
jgi:superfamily II DNA or RNA helicase